MLVLLTFTSYSQEHQNPKIKALEEFLIRNGFELKNKALFGGWRKSSSVNYFNSYRIRIPDSTATISEEESRHQLLEFDSITTKLRLEQETIWDSIRIFVRELTPETDECYLHENHKEHTDTINYTLRFEQNGGDVRETVYLQYYRIKDTKYYFVGSDFLYSYLERLDRSDNDKDTFDIAGFERYLKQALAPILKLKGVKQYPIYWEYDDSYPMEKNQRDEEYFLYPSLSYHNASNHKPPYRVTITGTDYFIPKAHIDSTDAFLRRIETDVVRYLEQHHEQYFEHRARYGYTEGPKWNPIWDFAPLHEFFYGGYKGYPYTSPACSLYAYTEDEEGVHLLFMQHPYYETWVPKGFEKMKRWVNGKATLRKE